MKKAQDSSVEELIMQQQETNRLLNDLVEIEEDRLESYQEYVEKVGKENLKQHKLYRVLLIIIVCLYLFIFLL
jgi:hypothetical protein